MNALQGGTLLGVSDPPRDRDLVHSPPPRKTHFQYKFSAAIVDFLRANCTPSSTRTSKNVASDTEKKKKQRRKRNNRKTRFPPSRPKQKQLKQTYVGHLNRFLRRSRRVQHTIDSERNCFVVFFVVVSIAPAPPFVSQIESDRPPFHAASFPDGRWREPCVFVRRTTNRKHGRPLFYCCARLSALLLPSIR